MSFGEFLKNVRTEKKISQRQLADLAGVSNTEISRLESGERQNPSPIILKSIAPHLNISYTKLMKEAGYFEEIVDHDNYTESIFRDLDGNLQDVLKAVKELNERDTEMVTIMKRISSELPEEDLKVIKDLAKVLLSKNQK